MSKDRGNASALPRFFDILDRNSLELRFFIFDSGFLVFVFADAGIMLVEISLAVGDGIPPLRGICKRKFIYEINSETEE